MQQTYIPITVLMPVYNAEKYLPSAIESILNQSFPEFELLIINDGSTDASGKIISSYRDSRIRYISNKTNLNLCRSLAKGVTLARGEFIARMDADDIAHTVRLEKQIAVMRANPDLDLLGTNVRWINQYGSLIGHPKLIADNIDLRWNIFFRNCFNHPTVIIRKSALNRSKLNYGVIPESIAPSLLRKLDGVGDEDYLLFGLLTLRGKVGNLDEPLLDYRIHNESLTAHFSEKQSEQTQRIAKSLRKIYLQSNSRSTLNNSNFILPGLVSSNSIEAIEIKAIAQKMLSDFHNPVSQQRIKFHFFMQTTVLLQDKQYFFERVLVGIKVILNFTSLKKADFLILLKYILGSNFIKFYRRY